MYRVVCYYEGQNWRRIVERGPWLASRADAEAWADADPYIAAGVYARVTIKPFKKVLPA